MFREYISHPIDPIPQEYVNTLQRLANEPDYSLTCFGISLLRSRVENYHGISGCYINYDDAETCVSDFIERDKTITDDNPSFCYYIYSHASIDETAATKSLNDMGYEVKENIGLLLSGKASTQCIAAFHKEKNSAVFFVNSRDIRIYHLVISFLSILFPKIFKEHPMQDNDFTVVKSLSKNEKNTFIQMIKQSVEPYSLEFKRIMLSALLKSIHEQKINQASEEVREKREYVEYTERQYAEALVALKELIVTYEGLKATEAYDKPEEDLVEYLSTNKNIHNMRVENGKIYFDVATLLNNYNENAWDTFSKAGHIFDGDYSGAALLDAFKDRNNRKILLNNIFSESPEFSVKICSNYVLDIQNYRMLTSGDYNYVDKDPMYTSYLPNPHIKLFACLGGYRDKVMRELRNRNYIGAVELCIASAGSINLDETTQTFRPFLGWILSSREKILRRKDGVEMTPEEALIWLVDEGGKE